MVNALSQLHNAKQIDADLAIEASDFAQAIAEYRDRLPDAPRPETEEPQPAEQAEPEQTSVDDA